VGARQVVLARVLRADRRRVRPSDVRRTLSNMRTMAAVPLTVTTVAYVAQQRDVGKPNRPWRSPCPSGMWPIDPHRSTTAVAESIRALLSLAAPRQQATVRSAPAAPQYVRRQTDRRSCGCVVLFVQLRADAARGRAVRLAALLAVHAGLVYLAVG
jgi:hypothetical protein